MFSRPVNSRPNPAPSSISVATRPPHPAKPRCSGMIPASTRSVEVLPAPLRPTMPNVSPGPTRTETPARAWVGWQLGLAAPGERGHELLQGPRAVGAGGERPPGVVENDLTRRERCAHSTTASSRENRRKTTTPAPRARARRGQDVAKRCERGDRARVDDRPHRGYERCDRVAPAQQRTDPGMVADALKALELEQDA